jgi:hypothetical protein
LKFIDACLQRVRVERLAVFENFIPAVFVFAGGGSVQNTHAMASRGKFCGSDENVGFRPGQRSVSFVDVEEIQSSVRVHKRTRAHNRAFPQQSWRNNAAEKPVVARLVLLNTRP